MGFLPNLDVFLIASSPSHRRPVRLTSDQSERPRAFPAVLFARAENLLVDTSPFRACFGVSSVIERFVFCFGEANLLVDTIGVVLSLNGNTWASTDRSGHRCPVHNKLLRALQLRASVHPVARIQHDTGLISPQISLDTRKRTRQRNDYRITRRLILDQPIPVITFACAVSTAVAREARLVASVAQGKAGSAGKVIDGSRGRSQNLASRKGTLVCLEVSNRVRHIQGVIPDLVRGGVLVSLKVEVGVLSQKNSFMVLAW